MLVHIQDTRQEATRIGSDAQLRDRRAQHGDHRADYLDEPQHTTEVVLTEEDGLPGTCAANFDNLQTVPKANIGNRITRLSASRMKEAVAAIAFALGFDSD